MGIRRSACALALASVWLQSCGGARQGESVLSSWSLSPPSGWVSSSPGTDAPLGAQQWRSPDGTQRILFAAFRRPDGKPAKLPSFVRFVRREQLCGGRDADVVQLRSQRGPDIGDAVQMQWHDMRATATYFYPSTASPDPKAEAAIRSICPNA